MGLPLEYSETSTPPEAVQAAPDATPEPPLDPAMTMQLLNNMTSACMTLGWYASAGDLINLTLAYYFALFGPSGMLNILEIMTPDEFDSLSRNAIFQMALTEYAWLWDT